MKRDPCEIDSDDLWPRDEQHRYRVYGVIGDDRGVLACAATPGGIGVAIVQLHEDCKAAGMRLADCGKIGVLDAVAGEWLVLPYDRATEPLTFGPKPRRIKEKRK
jgi:hypothetical protein